MRVHIDDRRRFVGDLFPTPGDVNVVRLQPGAILAWHRHQRQADYLFCVQGMVKVQVIDPEAVVHQYLLSEWDAQVLEIPPNHWHGYVCLGPERATLVGYITQKYDPADEERMSVEAMGVRWDTEAR